MLPFQDRIDVVGLIGAFLWPDEFCFDHLSGDHLQWLPVSLIEGEQEEREHNHHHTESCGAVPQGFPEKKEKRHSYKHRRGKADKLPLC